MAVKASNRCLPQWDRKEKQNSHELLIIGELGATCTKFRITMRASEQRWSMMRAPEPRFDEGGTHAASI
jgi:hypothetical protein